MNSCWTLAELLSYPYQTCTTSRPQPGQFLLPSRLIRKKSAEKFKDTLYLSAANKPQGLA
ncbi:hypothetical protein GM920_12040 [Pedobacter sp. LMG 31462]|uniref:Uncharacterized protein n=1 Tax=Pedobacter gandavensis TaxID=2679963 RepID=A0ABR6EWH6_9SPHI|nr:hypothetical protein [Pedobacter gandavensis]